MEIYTLNKTYQDYDGDHYQHWVSSFVMNYYLTKELAVEAMNDLIEQEESDNNKVWDAKLGDVRNIINIMTGSHNNNVFKDHNLYFIDSINVIRRKTNNTENMGDFKKYRRSQIAEIREVTDGDLYRFANYGCIEYSWTGKISISQADLENGSPKIGDMIGRNPKNHLDQWLIAEQYFKDNFESVENK